MNIQEIIKLGWQSETGTEALAKLVEDVLLSATEPMGTTKLLNILGGGEMKKLSSCLWAVRQRTDTNAFWAYTGKKTMYGKQAIHWLPMTAPRTAVKEDWDDAPISDEAKAQAVKEFWASPAGQAYLATQKKEEEF